MDYQEIIAGTVGKANTFGTCVGRVKAGVMSYARYSTDDNHGIIRGYTGKGSFTDDPLDTFGGAGVAQIPQLQKLLRFICREGFEHHVACQLQRRIQSRPRSRHPLYGLGFVPPWSRGGLRSFQFLVIWVPHPRRVLVYCGLGGMQMPSTSTGE